MSLTRSARGKGAGRYGLRAGRSLGADQAIPKSVASQGPVAAAKWKNEQAGLSGKQGVSGQTAFEKAAAAMVQKIKDERAAKVAPAAPTSAKPAAPAKPITPKRQAAIDAYTKAFDRAPVKSMTISGMNAAVKRAVYQRQSREYLQQQTPAHQNMPAKAPAPPVPRPNPNVEAVRNLDAKAMAAKRTQPRAPAIDHAARKAAFRSFDKNSGELLKSLEGMKSALAGAKSTLDDMARIVAPQKGGANIPKPPAPSPAPPSKWNSGPVLGQMKPAAASPTNYAEQLKASAAQETRSNNLGRLNTGLAAYGAGVQIANAYNRARDEGKSSGDAAVEAAKAGAVPAALATAPVWGRAGGTVAELGAAITRTGIDMASGIGGMLDNTVGLAISAKTTMLGGVTWVAGKAMQIAAKTAGPAVAAYGAYQGAKEDTANPMRGAARGAIRGLDPTSIFMAKGLGERAFDGAFGSVNPASNPAMGGKRLTSQDQKSFATANAQFSGKPTSAPREPGKGREYAGEFIDVTNANGTTFKRRNPDYGTAGEKR